MRMADGMMVALIHGEPPPPEVIDRIHIGSAPPDAQAVYALRKRLREEGVEEVAWWEEEGYTSLKVADPDGYVVELSYYVQ